MAQPALDPQSFRRMSGVSRETLARLDLYVETLRRWQARINLVSTSTLSDVWRRHILDSWQLVPLAADLSPGAWVDLGSGAGFPGLVVALCLAPGWQVHLIESDQRKAAFLREVARLTGTAVEIHVDRIEAVPPFPAKLISARALAPMTDLLPLAQRFWATDTVGLLLKGQNVNQELESISGHWHVTYDVIESRSDSSGRIVRLRNLERAP